MLGLTRRRTGASTCLLLLGFATFAFAACGGGAKKVDPEDWVADLCDASADFEEDLQNVGEDAEDLDLSAKGAKKDVVAVFNDQKKAITDFKAAYAKIGIPDIDDSAKVDEAVKETFKERENFINTLIKEVNKLDEGDDFEDDLDEAFEDLETPDGLLTRLEDIDENDVDDILDLIDEDSDCASTLGG